MEHQYPPSTFATHATFGDLLRHLRRQAYMTQRDLALATGYSVGQICRFEQNQHIPDLPTLTARFLPALVQANDTAMTERLLALADAARAAQQREQRRPPPVRLVAEEPGIGHDPALAPVAATTLTAPPDRSMISLMNGHTAEPSSQLIRMATGSATAQPVHTAAPPDRNRSRMLAKVKTFWIKGILEQSLHGAALIELGLILFVITILVNSLARVLVWRVGRRRGA